MALAYELTGSGRPLVLVHGITESRRTWDPLVPDLATDHEVLALDLPGHGASGSAPSYDVVSMAAAVAGTVEETGLERPLVVGHSLGGMVATAYAAFHPASGVVDVDQPLRLGSFAETLRALAPRLRGDQSSFQGAIRTVIDALRGPLPDAEMMRVDAARRADQDVVLGIWEPVLTMAPEELEVLVRSMAQLVQVPFLSLHGADPGEGYEAWLTAAMPSAVVEVWGGLGHYLHLVDPDRFLARVRAFEASLS